MKGNYIRNSSKDTSAKLQILKSLQLLPLDNKIDIANDIIMRSLDIGKPALLYSGGKDSTVLLDLLKPYKNDLIVMYNNTTLGSTDNLEYIRGAMAGYNYIETTASDPFAMWKSKGYFPILSKRGFTKYKKLYSNLKTSPVQCCYQLKEKYSNKVLLSNNIKVVFWGNRAGESNRRKFCFVDNGFLFKPKKYKWHQSYPLQHFTDNDIIEYLKAYIPEYDIVSYHETGCLCCGTDITFKDNTLMKLYANDYNAWVKYMKAGFAEQILIAKGHTDLSSETIDNIIMKHPKLILKI